METAMAAAGDGAWHERAQQLARDLELLREDSRALRRALDGAAADLAFQQECQAVLKDKLAETRLRRLHEFLRVPVDAKTLFIEETKPSARQLNPTMPRRELRALLVARWEALATDERDGWEARFREYTSRQESEKPVAGRKRPPPKVAVKAVAPVKTKSATDEPAATTPKKKKKKTAATPSSPSPSPSTPTRKRAKASKASAAVDLSRAEDPASGASEPGTPSSASSGGRSKKPSPRKKVTVAKEKPSTTVKEKPSPAVKSSKAAPKSSKTRSPAAKAPAATSKSTKAPAAAKKPAKKKKTTKDERFTRNFSASDEVDEEEEDEEEEDEEENESLSGGSPSDDDSDDNMAQLPTGAFG